MLKQLEAIALKGTHALVLGDTLTSDNQMLRRDLLQAVLPQGTTAACSLTPQKGQGAITYLFVQAVGEISAHALASAAWRKNA